MLLIYTHVMCGEGMNPTTATILPPYRLKLRPLAAAILAARGVGSTNPSFFETALSTPIMSCGEERWEGVNGATTKETVCERGAGVKGVYAARNKRALTYVLRTGLKHAMPGKYGPSHMFNHQQSHRGPFLC